MRHVCIVEDVRLRLKLWNLHWNGLDEYVVASRSIPPRIGHRYDDGISKDELLVPSIQMKNCNDHICISLFHCGLFGAISCARDGR